MIKNITWSFLLYIVFVLTAAFSWNNAAAQKSDTLDYVQPFAKANAFRSWSVGINGGVTMPFHDDYAKAGFQPAYGGFIKKQIVSTVGIQADFLAGKAQGNNSADGAYSKYLTTLDYMVDLSLNVTLANISWRHKRAFIQPYFTGGFGYMGYEPVITTAGAGSVTFPFKNTGANVQSFYIPVGAGFKFNVSRDVSLDLGYNVYFVSADNFDGFNYGGGRDKFSYGHFGIEIGLGSSKKLQLATHNPVASMRTEYLSIETKLKIQVEEQKSEIEKLRNELALKAELINATNASLIKFTIDSDNDGVPDLYDKCPNTPAGTITDGSGCPLNMARQPVATIVLTEQEKKVVKDAIDNLEFDFGKATIRPVSFERLDRVALLLKDRRANLKLAGYTDSRGPDVANLKISKDRAEAIKAYLVKRGISPAKIQAIGYGKENPIADNDTNEGRQANRRVEFNLY